MDTLIGAACLLIALSVPAGLVVAVMNMRRKPVPDPRVDMLAHQVGVLQAELARIGQRLAQLERAPAVSVAPAARPTPADPERAERITPTPDATLSTGLRETPTNFAEKPNWLNPTPVAPAVAPTSASSTLSDAPSNPAAPTAPAAPALAAPPTAPVVASAVTHSMTTPVERPTPGGASSINLEQWLGVRGAAALGSIVLVIAAFYLFAYGVDRGWFSPTLRVVVVGSLGALCVGGSFALRTRHPVLSNWLAGAGIAIEYGAIWAAHSLYRLIEGRVAYPAMIACTVACGVLAMRRDAMAVAGLGLAGGFATPILLTTGADRPIALFSYLFLLDLGVIATARFRRWPWMVVVALVLTSAYQLAWTVAHLDDPQPWLVVVMSVVFAGAFLAMPARHKDASGTKVANVLAAVVALLTPLAIAFQLGHQAPPDASVSPLATLLAILSAGAVAIAIGRKEAWIGTLACLGSALVVTMVALTGAKPDLETLPFVTFVGPIVAALVVIGELAVAHRLRAQSTERSSIALDAGSTWGVAFAQTSGAVATYLVVAHSDLPFGFQLSAAGILLVAALVAATFGRSVAAPLPVAVGLAMLLAPMGRAFASPTVAIAGLVVVAVMTGAVVTLPHAASRLSALGVGLAASILGWSVASIPNPSTWRGAWAGALVALAVATARASDGRRRLFALVFASAVVFARLALIAREERLAVGTNLAPQFVGLGVALLAFAIGAHVAPVGRRVSATPFRAFASALTVLGLNVVATFLALRDGYRGSGLVALGLAAFGALVGFLATKREFEDDAQRRIAIAWTTAVAGGWAVTAVALELEKEWITLGWALQALTFVAVDRKLDHPGLKYCALGLFVAVAIRLVANPAVLAYHERGWPVLNWLLYTYLVPAAAMIAGGSILAEHEVARRRPLEKSFFAMTNPVVAPVFIALGLIVGFAWVNLTVFDAFSVSREISLDFSRSSARDLTLSVGWAVYAITLLGVGMWRELSSLRWVSLLLILATVSKVFLFDLSNLTGLYRVGSLVGLAASLLIISIAYQRFVFRKTGAASAPTSPTP